MNLQKYFPLAIIALLTTTLSSCAAIEGIFKAGVWSGIIIVVVVLALVKSGYLAKSLVAAVRANTYRNTISVITSEPVRSFIF